MILPATARLLIVEDESVIRDILIWMVRPFRYEIATAGDGTEAVTMAAEFKPDCALLNFMMPTMDGLEASLRIRGALPNCKFAFFTGNYGRPEFHEKYRSYGFADDLVIGKPFTVVDVLRLLARAGFPARPIVPPDRVQEWIEDGTVLL